MHKPQSGPAVTLTGVTKRYGGKPALDDVSLDVTAGSFVALVGGSGSGKSTLIRTINRLVDPDDGRVLIDGKDVCDSAPPALRRRIGHVIQGVGLFPHMSVAANIAIGLRIAGVRDTAARVMELLDLVDLPRDFAARAPATLSGGQQQRVGVARALATAPGLMLLDEPFGALDPVTRDALARSYRALHDRLSLTSIMVTHDMAEALLTADRVVVLKGGRVVGDASPAELLRGGGGEEAQALVAVPRGQAERMAAMVRA
ncbi:ATP-binding cassette domain-containing protein [Sphingomonas sp. SUN039]|uniref:ATP-binding cassette domain-containing protein n=1 Tax=Sphingomonas sp. SUN039 TaxID=2937787 RepID=UPI002164E025|nr:ATP-binding cassette domain-containing protein [Sphingomonas sp. SUN039]UVO54907.1 ATP-binding cassette domain-containing protein [Sphingomonas sp. SUN039]